MTKHIQYWSPQVTIEHGLIEGEPDPYYRDRNRVSCSGLKPFLKSAAHGRAQGMGLVTIANPATLTFGRLCHTAVLEPHLLDLEYVVAPKVDRRTTAGKAAWAEFEEGVGSRTVVSEDQHSLALAIRDAVLSHPLAAAILEDGHAEVVQLWSIRDIPAKSRLDWLTEFEGSPLIFDLKTTQDASAADFPKSCARFKYAMQAAMYSDGYYAITGKKPRFVFCAVEKEPPFGVQLFEYDLDSLDRGRQQYLRAIDVYEAAVSSGKYEGYPTNIVQMELPPWG